MSLRASVPGAALAAAFPLTVPIFLGFWFLGMAYGVYMRVSGFSFVYPLVMSIVIFGGSLEFVAVALLLSPFAPVQTLLVALMIQGRHLFYGLAMLDRFRGLGWKRVYLVYAMCDETFALCYSAKVPQGVDRGWFLFFITFLDQVYWVSGATIGGLVGPFLTFDTTGLGFVMTAMFVVIFLEHLLQERKFLPAAIGTGAALACLQAFGPDSFLVPTMATILLLLAGLRRPLARAGKLPPAERPDAGAAAMDAKEEPFSLSRPPRPGQAHGQEDRPQELPGETGGAK